MARERHQQWPLEATFAAHQSEIDSRAVYNLWPQRPTRKRLFTSGKHESIELSC